MIKSVLAVLVVVLVSVTPACGGSAEGGGAGASAMCTLPPTAVIPPVCLACIKTSCPTVYADFCAADCGANETSAVCLSAQSEIGTCLQQPNCETECMATHGSAVGGASGVGPPGGVGQGGSAGVLPAQGAITLQIGGAPSSTCPEPAKTHLVGSPAPSAISPGNSLIDGQNGASISCSVRGSGPFTFSGSVHASDSENNPITVSFTDGQVGTDKMNGSVTLNVFTPQLGATFTSAPGACTVTVINQQVKPGSIWATFACPSITSAPAAQCQVGSTSTVVFENCAGS